MCPNNSQVRNTSQQEDLEGIARDVLRKHGVLITKEELEKIRQFLESNKCKMIPKE